MSHGKCVHSNKESTSMWQKVFVLYRKCIKSFKNRETSKEMVTCYIKAVMTMYRRMEKKIAEPHYGN